MSDYDIYKFDVKAGLDPMEWSSLTGRPDSMLYQEAALNHHSELVSFIMECQTYPTAQSKLLALQIAQNFNPAQGKAWPTQTQLAQLMGVGRDVIRRYTNDLKATGYWDVRKDPVTSMLSYHLSPETMVVLGIWLKRVRAGRRDYGFNTPSLILKADKARPGRRIGASPQPSQAPAAESPRVSYQDLLNSEQAPISTHSIEAMGEGKHPAETLDAIARIAGYWEERQSLPEGHSFHLLKHLLKGAETDAEPDALLALAENLVLSRKS